MTESVVWNEKPLTIGSGGGTSGRATASEGRPGSNPGFFSAQNCCQSIFTGCRAFPITYHRALLSSFTNVKISSQQFCKKKEEK